MVNSRENYICRLCKSYRDTTDLIIPCLCKNDDKYIHRICLDELRSEPSINKINFYECSKCKFQYEFIEKISDPAYKNKLNWDFVKYMAFEIMIAFGLSCLLIYLNGHIGYLFDVDMYIKQLLCNTDWCIIDNYEPNIILIGLFTTLIMLGIFGIIVWINKLDETERNYTSSTYRRHNYYPSYGYYPSPIYSSTTINNTYITNNSQPKTDTKTDSKTNNSSKTTETNKKSNTCGTYMIFAIVAYGLVFTLHKTFKYFWYLQQTYQTKMRTYLIETKMYIVKDFRNQEHV
jgi:hypothetical protein